MSLTIEKNVFLAPYTTFGIGGRAEYFVTVHTADELVEAITYAEDALLQVTILGGGSNMLISDNGIDGLVIHMMQEGITYTPHSDHTLVTAGAGVLLDLLIEDVIAHGLWGLENLTAIPGTVGATPIQNVGAYGVEVCDTILSVYAYDRVQKKCIELGNSECRFGYRDSVFKHEGKDRYVILAVTFRLRNSAQPQISYRDLALRFGENQQPSLREIQTAVREIRSTKFPDWSKLGTAGSFFKNPFIDSVHAEALSKKYPDIPLYKNDDGRFKVSLGWVLDHVLNLKGYREGHVGLYEKQALVVVNFGGATCDEVYAFSDVILKKIFDVTGITVEREVIVIQKK